MKGTYLYIKNTSTFEPQEKNPKREVYEDWTIFSCDQNRKKFAVREFNIEGYVNQFTLETLSKDNRNFVFVLESSENAPPGLRARLTYEIKNENEFIEIFEIAMPGGDFSEWLKNYRRRK